MEDRLVFLISAPRSGSTLLARCLGAHSAILSGPELHLLTPLAHLGLFDRVEKAPYDPVISQEALRELIDRLPGGERDYIGACRAYADTVYGKLLAARPGKELLLEQTPAYALIVPFILQLYPRARYVLLTRNPLAILSSQANSFFDGSYEEAIRQSPVLDRYVPAIARALREPPTRSVHVRYEEFVHHPAEELKRICQTLGVPFEEGMVTYGENREAETDSSSERRGLGDPIGVGQHTRPVTHSVDKWASEIGADPEKRALCLAALDGVDPLDLEAWGTPRQEIEKGLEKVRGTGAPRATPMTRYRLERRLLVRTRRAVRRVPLLTRLVERIKLSCELLLR